MSKATASDKFDFSTITEYSAQPNFYATSHYYELHCPEWLLTFEWHRDSDAYTFANLKVIKEELEAHAGEWDEMQVSHPAVGWVSFIICKPDSKALEIVAECMCAITEFPLLAEHRELVIHCDRCGGAELTENSVKGEIGVYCGSPCHESHESMTCDQCQDEYLEADMDRPHSEHGTFCDAECEQDWIEENKED
jgi:hypothetical protein